MSSGRIEGLESVPPPSLQLLPGQLCLYFLSIVALPPTSWGGEAETA